LRLVENLSAGRFFNAEEDAVPGRNPVVVISQALWRAQLGQSPDAVGRTVELNGQGYTIIGIAPGRDTLGCCDPRLLVARPASKPSRSDGGVAL